MLKKGEVVNTNIKVNTAEDLEIKLKTLLSDTLTVIYFYPKDNTPGCTKEACSFRDFNKDIKALGVKVIGVSKDSSASHEKFALKNNLDFTLISDEEGNLLEEFKVWKEKSIFGKTFLGIQRSTFVIDKEGRVLKHWEKVNPARHAEEVYNWLANYPYE